MFEDIKQLAEATHNQKCSKNCSRLVTISVNNIFNPCCYFRPKHWCIDSLLAPKKARQSASRLAMQPAGKVARVQILAQL